MEKSMIEIKNELIDWIENTFDRELLQKILELKYENSSLISDINSEEILENNFDEQFAAGMTSDELLENVAAHMESIAEQENTSVVSENSAEYSVKDDFDERFARGLSSEESRKRTREFISKLPWKK